MNNLQIFVSKDFRESYEASWIKELLGDRLYKKISVWDELNININSKIVLIGSKLLNNSKLLIDKKIDFGVILLSDENLVDPCVYAESEYCKFVYRNYVHPHLVSNTKVKTFGLGYKRNFQHLLNPKSYWERPYSWNFIGSIHHDDRAKALEEFSKLIGKGYIHKTSHFNADDYLGVDEYARVLSESVYTLCPYGHVNMDTFRVYEALEAGSIPVTLKYAPSLKAEPNYWYFVFRGDSVPFVVANNWEEAFQKVEKLLQSSASILIQEKCIAFWEKWKAIWKSEIKSSIIDLSFS